MPYQLKLKLTLPTVPTLPTAGLTDRIRNRFALEAGQMIILAIREHLGNDIYQLSPGYAARKPSLKEFRRYPGKTADQPLILSGRGIFDALQWRLDGNTLVVDVDETKGDDRGFDVAEYWEEITSYLELGFADVETTLDDHLLDIVFQEMAL